MTALTLVWGNIRRNRLQSALLIVTIAVAFLIYGVLASFLWFFNSGIDAARPERIITINRIHVTQPLPLAYAERIAEIPGVEAVTHSTWFGGYYQDARQSLPVFAIDAETYLGIFPDIEISAPERAAFLADRNAVIVGDTTARAHGWRVGDTIPLMSNIYRDAGGASAWQFTIAGIFSPADARGDTRSVYMHYDRLNQAASFGRDRVGLFITRFASGADAAEGARRIDALFANSPSETKSQSEESFNRAFLNQIGDIVLIVQLIVGAAMFTVLMVVTNTMLLAVRQRRSEHGLLKTLGFKSRFLFATILAESFTQFAIGGLAGLALAALVLAALQELFQGFMPGLTMPIVVVGGGLAMILLLSLLVGLVPALLAHRLDPVAALRKTG